MMNINVLKFCHGWIDLSVVNNFRQERFELEGIRCLYFEIFEISRQQIYQTNDYLGSLKEWNDHIMIIS